MAVPRADLYRMSGSNVSLEANYLTWTGSVAGLPAASFARNIEEFAVASLLWDLVDPADADDATTFSAGGASYADCVATDLASLWGIISKPWGGVVVGSPQTPLTYTYIYDVKHLYDVLKHEGVGAAKSRGRALDDLDELFIAHGFFKDANSNRVYDAGEAIGWSGHGALPGATARLDRRSRPPIKGSYIAYQARSSQTGAPVPVQSVSVDVRFPPPLEHLDFSYTQPVETPGHIYFFAPDAQYGAASYVRAWAPGWVATAPLTVTSSLYWERMAAEPQDHFVDHIFEMTRTVSLYLPLIVSEHGGSATTADALGATISAATAARTPRACAPEPIGGTATRTATRTATVQSGGSRTATVTATRTPTRTGTRTPTRTATRTLTRTATRTVTQTPTRTTTAGINGRVTANGAAAAGRTLELRHWNGSAWVIQSSVTTGADGRYTFSGVPALGANQWYYVRYLNSAAAPNPGPGYLWYWFANRFSSYTAGTTVAGGDFDIADVVMTQPADGATVTLPAAFCWTQRNEPSDNYRLIFRNPRTGQEALTNYLGYSPSCVIITAIPPDWPSGAVYTWWVRVYRGANPDATPDNYGDPSTTRDVRINH
jgi:hypothetical protein